MHQGLYQWQNDKQTDKQALYFFDVYRVCKPNEGAFNPRDGKNDRILLKEAIQLIYLPYYLSPIKYWLLSMNYLLPKDYLSPDNYILPNYNWY